MFCSLVRDKNNTSIIPDTHVPPPYTYPCVCVNEIHVNILYIHVSVSGEEGVCEEMGCGGDEGIWG